jgi:hypothetical protein
MGVYTDSDERVGTQKDDNDPSSFCVFEYLGFFFLFVPFFVGWVNKLTPLSDIWKSKSMQVESYHKTTPLEK